MDVEFDPAKDAANRAKHGVPLAFGALVLAEPLGEFEDRRRDYGEVRRVAYGLVAGRLFCCAYTLRGDVRRIISIRKANSREQAAWQP